MTETAPKTENVILSEDGPVATITLNRPRQYNSFNKEMRREMMAAVVYVEASDSIRVCIIRGAGPGFSAGADVTDFDYDPISNLILGEFKPFLTRIYEGKCLYIAQVHGNVAGISIALAMSCDFMTMSEDSAIYLAFAALALVPDGGVSWHLVNAMGRQRALQAIIEGQKIGAGRCLDLGLANHVVPADELTEKTNAWARQLARSAPHAASAAKRLIAAAPYIGYADAIDLEAAEQNVLARTNDFKRCVDAFAKRTTPEFWGN